MKATEKQFLRSDKYPSVAEHSEIHGMLLKEASDKREHRKKAAVHEILFTEAEESLKKESMATQSGGSTLRNSGWNTDWDFVDPTQSIENAKKQVGRKAQQFFASLQGHGMGGGTDLSPNPVAFIFRYIRTILPNNNGEAATKAKTALEVLDENFRGFRQFQQDIEAANIPLNPYFMVSMFSKNNGRVSREQMPQFIQDEIRQPPLQLPDGRQVPNQSHYRKHANSGAFEITAYPNKPRVFPMSDLDKVSNESMLTQAIDDKKNNGYALKFKSQGRSDQQESLQFAIKKLYNQRLTANKIDPNNPEHHEQRDIYIDHYKKLYQDMGTWYKDRSVKLPAFALRMVLRHLYYTAGGTPKVAQDQFRIPKANSPYYSNGWDSTPENPNGQMLTLPPLRQLPRGEVVYDRGNGNMGYDHLVLNWKNGLDKLLSKWGAQCDEWLRGLQGGQMIQNIASQSPEVALAWQNIISLQDGNRTGAETLLSLLRDFPDFDKFNKNHLQKSLSAEIRTVNNLRKNQVGRQYFAEQNLPQEVTSVTQQIQAAAQSDPAQAQGILEQASSELVQIYMGDRLDWKNLTLALNYMNSASGRLIKGNGMTVHPGARQESMVDAQGFELLKQYGYQVGKMMDFLFAVMTRSSHEKINTLQNGQTEHLFGHQYSTSSGKSKGGNITLSVYYDQLNAQLSGQNVEVNEKQQFTLGQSTGENDDPIILRSTLPWSQMVDAFNELYPEAGYQFSEINEPVSHNLEQLEIAIKQAIDEARGEIEVIYNNSEGIPTRLSGRELAAEEMQAKENRGETNLVEPSTVEPSIADPATPGQQWNMNFDPVPTPDQVQDEVVPEQPVPVQPPPEEELMPKKPMHDPTLDFVGKDKTKRRLIKQRTGGPMGMASVEERLQKAANKLDECGENIVADKIDLLLTKLCEMDNVRKTSRV